MHDGQAREWVCRGGKWPAAENVQGGEKRVGTGEGTRAGNAFKSSPEQWGTLPRVHTSDALHGTTLQSGRRACRARAALVCLMLMLSAREGSRRSEGGISGSARRLMESCQRRARARALAVISARDVVMVTAAPTPPQRAPHLALVVTAVARTSRINGHRSAEWLQSSRPEIKAEMKGLPERAGGIIYQEPREVTGIFC